MDRQEVTLLLLLDLIAAFDTVDHETTAALHESDFGLANQALLWIKSFLSGRKQRVVVEQKQLRDFDVVTEIPKGSCLGPILFIMYASRLFYVVKKQLPSIQCYADDTQLYLSFRPDSTTSNNYLNLNDTKTEFLVIGSRQQLTKIKFDSIRVGSTEIQKVSSVRNLGAWFDTSMTMTTHWQGLH